MPIVLTQRTTFLVLASRGLLEALTDEVAPLLVLKFLRRGLGLRVEGWSSVGGFWVLEHEPRRAAQVLALRQGLSPAGTCFPALLLHRSAIPAPPHPTPFHCTLAGDNCHRLGHPGRLLAPLFERYRACCRTGAGGGCRRQAGRAPRVVRGGVHRAVERVKPWSHLSHQTIASPWHHHGRVLADPEAGSAPSPPLCPHLILRQTRLPTSVPGAAPVYIDFCMHRRSTPATPSH